MTRMELKQLNMRGQIMEVIDRASPVMGWDVWCRIAEVNSWDEQNQTEYRRFKRELGALEGLGYIAVVTKVKNRARSSWDLTEEGDVWWQVDGQKECAVLGEMPERVDQFITGKWMPRSELPKLPRTWSRIAAMALRGEIRVAIKRVE